ncbi:hypothetical protein ACFLYF_00580 [Chloroflexota bacterium]
MSEEGLTIEPGRNGKPKKKGFREIFAGSVAIKNQYFGDNRDLFKYDLIMHVVKVGLVKQFVFIPMLTGPDDALHGKAADRSRAKAGIKNRALVAFLDKCISEGKRDIEQLKGFFNQQDIEMKIYGAEEYFSRERRREYFAQIGDELLSESLVFVDPDNGLEVRRSGEKHLLYDEIGELYRRMGEGSILMLCQNFPRRPRQEYLNTRCTEIKEKITGDWPVCIDDDRIAFFFLTANESMEHSLTHVIGDYAEQYSG